MSGYDIDIDELNKTLVSRLKPSRYEHTKNVEQLAKEMAVKYGVDEKKAVIAALFHDFCKDSAMENNNLMHAGLAADVAEKEYGITDSDILNAIRYHTTGRRGMSKLELVIFLADTLEPGREYSNVDELRDIAMEDLYNGALEVLYELKIYLLNNGYSNSQDSEEAINWLEGRNL